MEEDNSIKCVRGTTLNLIFREHKLWTVILIILAFGIIFLAPLTPITEILRVIIIPTFLFFYVVILNEKARKRFMVDFARANNFEYKGSLPLDSIEGRLFKFGHSKKIFHGMAGTYNNKDFRLFKYQTIVGKGRYQQVYRFTVFEIFFKKVEFPSILLLSRKGQRLLLGWLLRMGSKEIRLEYEFKKDFSLFCTDGYEVETLQIFTPEKLHFLKEKKFRFNVEMAGNRLYIYEHGFISTQKGLNELYEVAKVVIESLAPIMNRLSNDFSALHKYYKK